MLDDYLQQWTALQTVRASNLRLDEVFLAYLSIGGASDEVDVTGYLTGLVMIPALERDQVAQAINELLDVTGSLVDGAHYSTDDITAGSGYGEYLRTLVLTPDGYAFNVPPIGDASTSSSTPHALQGAHDAGVDTAAADDIEFRRCHALYESGLIEAGSEARFDRITAQVRDHFGVSSASIALITEDSQIIKSVIGPIGQNLPRDLSLCSRTIEKDRTLVITDASTDPTYRDHPLVAGGPEVRFYAGHPVSTASGWRIGTLCLIDDRPRAFTEDDEQDLRTFAARVQAEMWVSPLH